MIKKPATESTVAQDHQLIETLYSVDQIGKRH